MAKNIKLCDEVGHANYINEKYKFVYSKFPDCFLQKTYLDFINANPVFLSKSVNSCYNKLIFDSNSRRVIVMPVYELDFEYNGKVEKIKIHSSPKRSLLAKVAVKYIYSKDDASTTTSSGWPGSRSGSFAKLKEIKKTLCFSRLSFNLKNNNFDDKMLN
jgi:hypothetical protein